MSASTILTSKRGFVHSSAFAVACMVASVVPAWGYSVGDTIVFSNTNGAAVSETKYSKAQFSFCIPAEEGLPAQTVLQVKRIKLVSRHAAFSNNTSDKDADPDMLNLNGYGSDACVFLSDESSKIGGKCVLSYSFPSPCYVEVASNYVSGAGMSAGSGRGVTLCAGNGKRQMSNGNDLTAVAHGSTAGAGIMVNESAQNFFPLYEVEAIVVSIPGSGSLTLPAFSYTPSVVAGGAISYNYNNWFSLGGSFSRCRIGPGGAGLAYDMGSASGLYSSFSSVPAQFSFAIYADVSHVQDEGRVALVSFGKSAVNTQGRVILYREGDKLKCGTFNKDAAFTAVNTPASLDVPSSGYHLIVCSYDSNTGGTTMYVDNTSSFSSSADNVVLSYGVGTGFQIASIHGGVGSSGFSTPSDFPLAQMYGYNSILSAADVDFLANQFPATDGTKITADVDPNISGTLTVYSSDETKPLFLGITSGTLTIPADETVTVSSMRTLNVNNPANSVTVNIAGTVNVTNEMGSIGSLSGTTCTGSPYALKGEYKGILFGHLNGAGTYNVTGELNAPKAYLQTTYTANNQVVNVSGGLLRTKGFYTDNHDFSTINLSNGGKIEVGEIVSNSLTCRFARNFGYGTYSILSDAVEPTPHPINFNAPSGYATTIDVNAHALTLNASVMMGSGDVYFESTGGSGSVMMYLQPSYAGTIVVDDGVALTMVVSDDDYLFGKTYSNVKVKTGGGLKFYRNGDIDDSAVVSQTTGDVAIYTLKPQGKVWTGAGDGTFSDAGNWQVGVPASGEKFSIQASGEKTLSLNMASVVESPEVHVIGSGSLVIAGAGGGTLLAVTNLVIDGVAVTVNTAVFQPQTVTFLNGGSLAIGENGLLTDAVFTYAGALPTSGTAFTATTIPSVISEGARWQGTVWFKELTATASGQAGWNFDLDLYGNAGSAVRFSGVSAFFKVGRNNFKPALEVVNAGYDYAWEIPNGYSCAYNNGPGNNSYYAYGKISKLSGDGRIYCHGSGGNKALVVVADGSAFTGVLDLETKSFWFGDVIPEVPADGQSGIVTEGSVVVWPGATGALGITVTQQWNAVGGITIAGELKTSNLNLFTAVTTNTVLDTGTFTFMKTDTGSNDNSQNTDFGRVTGTGTIKYSGTGFCLISTNNFPTAMTFEAANGNGTVVPYVGAVVGSLSGSGNLRSDWENSSQRNFAILQATNTTWAGVFNNADRIDTVTVLPGVDSSGTLTLAGTQTQENKLTVATNASVNITGKWVGAVSVSGTIAGTGTIDGALTVSDGATIKVNGAEPLKVTGNVTLSGNIAIVVADDVGVSQLTILRVTGDGATLNLSEASFTVRNESGKAVRARIVAKSKELRFSKGGFYIHLQ